MVDDERNNSSELFKILMKNKMIMEKQTDDIHFRRPLVGGETPRPAPRQGGQLYKIIDKIEAEKTEQKKEQPEEIEDDIYEIPEEPKQRFQSSHLFPLKSQTSVDSSISINSFLSCNTTGIFSQDSFSSCDSSENGYASYMPRYENVNPKREKPKILPKPSSSILNKAPPFRRLPKRRLNPVFKESSSDESAFYESGLSTATNESEYYYEILGPNDNNNNSDRDLSRSMSDMTVRENLECDLSVKDKCISEENIYCEVDHGGARDSMLDSGSITSDEFGNEHKEGDVRLLVSNFAVNNYLVSDKEESQMSKPEKYQKALAERAAELLETEAVYVRKLRHAVREYVPMVRRKGVPDALAGGESSIFSNMRQLYRFHACSLLPALREASTNMAGVASAFLDHEKQLEMYIEYSRNNRSAISLFHQNKDFFTVKQLELGDRLDLSSFLLEPIQRMPRYQLFLEDLTKTYALYEREMAGPRVSCSNPVMKLMQGEDGESQEPDDGMDYLATLKNLKAALSMIKSILKRINDAIALENIRDCPINIEKQGNLLRQDEFTVIDKTKRRQLMRIFLFESVIVFTAVVRKPSHEVFLFCDYMQMWDLGLSPPENDTAGHFQVWFRKRTERPYTILGTVSQQRHWVREISRLLSEQAEMYKERLKAGRKERQLIRLQMPVPEEPASPCPGLSSDHLTASGLHQPTTASLSSTDASLRGVAGEMRTPKKKKPKRTTWYLE